MVRQRHGKWLSQQWRVADAVYFQRMALKAIIFAVAFWGMIAVIGYAFIKYGLPEYYAWKERKAELEKEKEEAEKERVEMLLDEAEDE